MYVLQRLQLLEENGGTEVLCMVRYVEVRTSDAASMELLPIW